MEWSWPIAENRAKRWRRFVYLDPFEVEAKSCGLRDEDRRELELVLCGDPAAGDLITGTGGCRKLRFAPSRWGVGKRGALRIYYAWFERAGIFAMIYLHTKSQRESISAAEKRSIKVLIEQIEQHLRPRS